MADRARIAVALLSFSAAGFVWLTQREGYTDRAVIPTPGDVPTIGFGSTTREDGSPVTMADKTTPPKAMARALKDVQAFEGALRRCVKVPLHQHEYDAYVRFSYNVGSAAFCSSAMVAKLNSGDYASACAEFDRWYRAAGKDCRVKSNQCYGVIIDRQESRALCEGRAK